MRIAVIVNGFPVLSETFIVNKVLGLREHGQDVTVLAHSRSNDLRLLAGRFGPQAMPPVTYSLTTGGMLPGARNVGAMVSRFPRHGMQVLAQAVWLYGRTRRALRAWVLALPLRVGRYELIHFEYSGLAAMYLDALPLLRPAKLLTSCRGAAEQITPLMRPERAHQLAQVFAVVDRVHCVSHDILHTVEAYGLPAEKAFVNHPSIDPQQFRRSLPYPSKTGGPFELLSTGRLHWKKGFEYGLLAVRKLLDEGYDIRYRIIGGGPEEEHLRFTIRDLDLDERVQLCGRQPPEAIRRGLEAADVFVLPSLSEGLSNAALEAMAMELPLVATTAGGMGEAIVDGQEGFLVAPRQPEMMAARLRTLLDAFDLRQTMGQAGRRRIEDHFNLDRNIRTFVSEYTALVRKPLPMTAG